jgi:hypothetical protein
MRSKYYMGSVQKGTRVKWAKDRRAGSGVVTRVNRGADFIDQRSWIVKDDETGDEIECNVNQIKYEKSPNRVKKQLYAIKKGLR